MKKLLLLLGLVLAFNFSSFAQNELTFENPTLKVENKIYHLVGFTTFDQAIIKVEEYRENGELYQVGNLVDGKPDGMWSMYDHNGKLLATMEYNMGIKEVLTNYTDNGEFIIHYINNKPYKQVNIAYLN